jgi:hypothetical protein
MDAWATPDDYRHTWLYGMDILYKIKIYISYNIVLFA